MRQTIIIATAILASGNFAEAAEVVWTETFDTGVGRFDQTTGNGDWRYVWNASSQAIDATYFRASSADMRYADLGQTFNVADVGIGFNTIVKPTFGNGQSVHAGGKIGFLNPVDGLYRNNLYLSFNDGNSGNWFKLRGFDNFGAEVQGSVLPYSMGATYYVEALFDHGDARIDIWQGTDNTGSYLGSLTKDITSREIYVDSLGLFNSAAGGGNRTLNATIYEISYTVPEPTTIFLLSTAGLLALRRRPYRREI